MLSFMKNCSTQAMLTQKAQEHLILDVRGIHKISGKFSIWSIQQSDLKQLCVFSGTVFGSDAPCY